MKLIENIYIYIYGSLQPMCGKGFLKMQNVQTMRRNEICLTLLRLSFLLPAPAVKGWASRVIHSDNFICANLVALQSGPLCWWVNLLQRRRHPLSSLPETLCKGVVHLSLPGRLSKLPVPSHSCLGKYPIPAQPYPILLWTHLNQSSMLALKYKSSLPFFRRKRVERITQKQYTTNLAHTMSNWGRKTQI